MARRRRIELERRPPEKQPYVTPTGHFIDPVEAERVRREDELREEARRSRREERQAEAEAIRKARERWEREAAGDPYSRKTARPDCASRCATPRGLALSRQCRAGPRRRDPLERFCPSGAGTLWG
jgi:hypothetical protein